jgi:hypothetical protein
MLTDVSFKVDNLVSVRDIKPFLLSTKLAKNKMTLLLRRCEFTLPHRNPIILIENAWREIGCLLRFSRLRLPLNSPLRFWLIGGLFVPSFGKCCHSSLIKLFVQRFQRKICPEILAVYNFSFLFSNGRQIACIHSLQCLLDTSVMNYEEYRKW